MRQLPHRGGQGPGRIVIVLVIRGLLSLVLSRWDTDFAERLKARGIDSVETDHGWAVSWFSNVTRMLDWCLDAHKEGQKIVLVGHSFGATSVLMLARSLYERHIKVDFAGPIDPAYQYDTSVTSNVVKGLSFYQRTPGQLGQGIVHADHTWTPGVWDTVWQVHKRNETHLGIAADPAVQEAMANGVEQCLKS